MNDDTPRAGAQTEPSWDVGRPLRLDVGRTGLVGRDGETPNNFIVRVDPRFPERTGKRA
jgi:hypothetical protein